MEFDMASPNKKTCNCSLNVTVPEQCIGVKQIIDYDKKSLELHADNHSNKVRNMLLLTTVVTSVTDVSV